MEVDSVHMDRELNETQVNLKKKLAAPTVLDSFTKLTSDVEKVRLNAGVNLLKHLTEDNDKISNEQSYALDRLIRGVGSSRTSAKTGFYTVLVTFLKNTDTITIEQVFQRIEKHLSTGGSNSKSENADICMGQILVCGALIHAGLFTKASETLQSKMIQILVNAGNKRSYLSLASYSFLIEILQQSDENQFQTILWPIVKTEIAKPWKEQSLDSIYFLTEARSKYPNVVKQKFLNKILGTPEIVHEDSVKPLCELLLNIPLMASLKHPIYNVLGKKLGESNLIRSWCLEMDEQLVRPTRNKHLAATSLMTIILENIEDKTQIPDILQTHYLNVTFNTFRNIRGKDRNDYFVNKMYKLFDTLDVTLKKEEVGTKTKIAVLKKLIFYPGTLIFEKITRSKLIQHITFGLDADGVKKLSKLYKEVVIASKPRIVREDKVENWINMDRIYAAQLFVKLIAHASMQKEIDWRLEQAKFLLGLALFKSEDSNVGVELAASIKDCFYKVLDLKFPNLEDLRNTLSSLVHYIHEEIFANNNNDNLRTPLAEEGVEIWQNMINLIETLETKKKFKHSYAVPVFHTLLLHMGLQILSDFEMAQNALKELHSCFKRLETDKHKATDNEPMWVEVVVDLFLSLLSQNSHLLRNVIGCVFPYLCPHLSLQALHQILDTLDPKNNENPLSNKVKDDDEESGSEEESDDENVKSSDEECEEEESDLEEEEEGANEHETATDKLRMAVRDALHKSGYQTDDESVDMDEMDEEEGNKLDEALAEAFKNIKKSKGKNSKQNKDDKTLTHFRVRVLDLIEMYIDSEPDMLYCLEIAISLLQILEFSIRDPHQKPLENRVRTCLKKLTALKKFRSTDGVTTKVLVDMLNSFLDKGSKSAFIYQDMGDKISNCCCFIIKCSQMISTETPKKKSRTSPVAEILRNSLETFFTKRDCLLPIVLFKNVLQTLYDGNWALIPLLAEYPFSDDIRPFRRSQALELLRLFYSNSRFRLADSTTFSKKIASVESKLSENSIELLNSLSQNPKECKVKEKFVCHLLNLLSAVKAANATQNINWDTIGNLVREYRSHVTLAKDAKVAYNKLCRALGIPNLVKMNILNGNDDHESTEDENETNSQNSQEDKKMDKKRKKAKSLKKDKQKLKKEARLLRLKASSEGLENEVVFSTVSLNEITNEEPEESNQSDDEKSPRKRKNSHSEQVPKKKKRKSK